MTVCGSEFFLFGFNSDPLTFIWIRIRIRTRILYTFILTQAISKFPLIAYEYLMYTLLVLQRKRFVAVKHVLLFEFGFGSGKKFRIWIRNTARGWQNQNALEVRVGWEVPH
jgi:hypothetical protein